MSHIFRRLLIRLGKLLPFLFVAIVLIGYVENLYAVVTEQVVEMGDGFYTYNTPISNYIGECIYIDYQDVFLLYVLCVALELCWKTFACVHLLTLNLGVRWLLESGLLEIGTCTFLCSFMTILSAFCVCLGIAMLHNKKIKQC